LSVVEGDRGLAGMAASLAAAGALLGL
jgi:hypothetical protein